MSDFGQTLKLFSKAKLGDALPLEQLEAASRAARGKASAVMRRNAKREQPTHKAVGRLVFSSTAGDPEPKPLTFMKVELWDRDFGSPDDYLGSGHTDARGRSVRAAWPLPRCASSTPVSLPLPMHVRRAKRRFSA